MNNELNEGGIVFPSNYPETTKVATMCIDNKDPKNCILISNN